MPTRTENGQSKSIGEGSDKHSDIMAQIPNNEKLRALIQDGKPAPAPFNGVVYNQEAQLDSVGGNLSPTSSMTASIRGGDSNATTPERSTSDIAETGFHAIGRTGSTALNDLDEVKPDNNESKYDNPETRKEKTLAVEGNGMASALVLQAINEESDNGASRGQSEKQGTKEVGRKNWLSGFFGSFKRSKVGKGAVVKEEGTSNLDTKSAEEQQNPNQHSDNNNVGGESGGAAEVAAAESNEVYEEEEEQIQAQVIQEHVEQGEATIMENQEVEEIKQEDLQLEQTITVEPVETEENEQEQEPELLTKKISNIPVPPPLPPKPIDRSNPGDVSSIASKFNIPEKPLIPKVKKTASYLKGDTGGITLGMRRAPPPPAPSTSQKKLLDEQQPTSSLQKSASVTSSTPRLDDPENEAVSDQMMSEENRVQKLMKGWHQGAPIKAQALGEEDQEPEIEQIPSLSLDKQASSGSIREPPPKNQNISTIRDQFKAQEQRFLEKRASRKVADTVGVRGAVLKFDVPPPKPPKKEVDKDTSFGQNLLRFQEESKAASK